MSGSTAMRYTLSDDLWAALEPLVRKAKRFKGDQPLALPGREFFEALSLSRGRLCSRVIVTAVDEDTAIAVAVVPGPSGRRAAAGADAGQDTGGPGGGGVGRGQGVRRGRGRARRGR